MKISIAICTHNEKEYIEQLFGQLNDHCATDKSGAEWEVVVIDDHSTDVKTHELLFHYEYDVGLIKVHKHALNGDFAEHKNFMNSKCSGDWIINLDADESFPFDLLSYLPVIIDSNPNVEAYWIPRINTVDGLTFKHIQKWGWVLTKFDNFRKVKVIDSNSEEYELLKKFNFIISEENGFVTYYEPIVAWPDLQMRLYKNDSNIKWVNKVHERLTGFKNFSMFPTEPEYAIRHFKEIKRQEEQNALYETIK